MKFPAQSREALRIASGTFPVVQERFARFSATRFRMLGHFSLTLLDVSTHRALSIPFIIKKSSVVVQASDTAAKSSCGQVTSDHEVSVKAYAEE